MRKILIIIISILLIIFFPAKGENKDTLIFAGDYIFPPIEYLDSQGKPQGFAVDIIRELQKRINKKIDIVLVPWNEAVELLDKGKIDGIEFMRVNDERKKKYDFITYLESFSVIITPIDSPIQSFIDLKNRKVAVINQDVAHIFLTNISKTIPFKNSELVLQALIEGKAETGVLNYYTARYLINKNNWNAQLKILQDKLFSSYSGIALPKGSPYYFEINKGISDILKSTYYRDLLTKWFGQEVLLRLEYKKEEAKSQALIFIITIIALLLLGILGSREYLKREVKKRTQEINLAYNFLKEISQKDLEDIEKICFEKLKELFPNSRIKYFKRTNGEFFLIYSYPQEKGYSLTIEDIENIEGYRRYFMVEESIYSVLIIEENISHPITYFNLLLEEFQNALTRLYIKERIDKEKEINEIINLLSKKEDENILLENLLKRILHILKADAGSIMVYDKENKILKIKVGINLSREVIKNTVLKEGEGIAGWVLDHREPLILEDVYKDNRFKIIEPRFEIKSSICYPLIHKNKPVGVININNLRENKIFNHDDLSIIEKFAPLISAYIYNEEIEEKIFKLHHETLITIVDIIDARDPYTGGHSREVGDIAINFGRSLLLDEEDMRRLEYSAYLHDIGKIKVPDFILKEPGKLSDEEYMIMKMHPIWGEELLQHISVFRDIGKIIRHHHERWDGKGYPDGLSGNDIPFLTRIITLADSFQAMTASRPYKRKLNIEEAIQEIKRCKGTQFDPELADYFIEFILKENKVINN